MPNFRFLPPTDSGQSQPLAIPRAQPLESSPFSDLARQAALALAAGTQGEPQTRQPPVVDPGVAGPARGVAAQAAADAPPVTTGLNPQTLRLLQLMLAR